MADYKELVEQLRCNEDVVDCSKCEYGRYTNRCDTARMMLDAADAIEKLVSNAGKFKLISVEDRLPELAGEYIVAYHPCYWDDVKTAVTKVGIDTFRGKTAWAKKKYQRVTHWMPLPEPPKEEEHDE